MLSSIPSSDLVHNQSALTLFRALVNVNQPGERNIQYYAALPPQLDSDEEELRVLAVRVEAKLERKRRWRKEWVNLLGESMLESSDPEADDRLK